MMLQVEWYCDKCKVTHFGNCPMLTVIMTTSEATDPIEINLGSGEPPASKRASHV